MKKNIKIGLLAVVAVYLLSCENPVKPVQDNVYDPGSENFVVVADLATNDVTDIRAVEAVSGGRFENDYGTPVTAKGVCWGTDVNPLVGGSCTNDGEGFGEFTSRLTNLIPETSYYVRAYATNADSTIYGEQLEFTTRDGLIELTTGAASSITAITATVGGQISGDGGADITVKGVVWSTDQSPTLQTNNGITTEGAGTGAFTSHITGLTLETTYYVRAYATNDVSGTNYGNQVEFTTTGNTPTVTTGVVSSITETGATASASVTNAGSSSVTSRGVCYSTVQNPTTSSSCVNSGSGTGSFSVTLSGLSTNTTYYVRAYATSNVGTSYSSQVEFTTLAGPPSVSTGSVSGINSSGASVAGNVTDSGGATITARGVCYAKTQNPTTSNSCVASGSGIGMFLATITGLSPGIMYYVRAFATNSAGTAYGSQTTFTTMATIPSVITGSVSNLTATSATVAGEVTSGGGAVVTTRGICYATSQNPTTSNTCVATGSSLGAFTAAITGLTTGTTYYFRAFATNSIGTAYGAQHSFTPTEACLVLPQPTPSTNFVMQTNTKVFFKSGDVYTITMYSTIYHFGQGNVSLYRNNTLIQSYGSWLVFGSTHNSAGIANARDFTLPQSLETSRCYNMRVTKGGLLNTDELWVGPYFEVRE
jgi:hypothetical protein